MTGDDELAGGAQQPDPELAGPLVFISHDSRDAKIAEAFCELLSNVSAGMLQTFRSSDKKGSQGFEFGVEWYPELMKRLEVSCDVVCLLTRRSLNRPWLLYEAGVAKGKLDVPVHGLALGVPLSKASSGPFAQFQNCDDEQESISKLVVQLVKRLPHASPNGALVSAQVGEFLKAIAPVLAEDGEGDAPAGPFEDESTAKLFEEIKVMFQDLPMRVERAVSPESPPRRRRLHPGMIEELIMGRRGRGAESVGIAAVMLASLVKDDIPWLLPLATAVYEAELAGSKEVARKATFQFVDAAEAAMDSPMIMEFRGSSIDRRTLLEFPMMMRHIVGRYLDEDPEPAPEPRQAGDG